MADNTSAHAVFGVSKAPYPRLTMRVAGIKQKPACVRRGSAACYVARTVPPDMAKRRLDPGGPRRNPVMTSPSDDLTGTAGDAKLPQVASCRGLLAMRRCHEERPGVD